MKRAGHRWLVNEFQTYYYYYAAPWKRTTWLGVPVLQYPSDLIVLQEVIWDTRPELIIESGTAYGGTALFFATILDGIGSGEVLTLDIDHSRVKPRSRSHSRVRLLTADSTKPESSEEVRRRAEGYRTMIFLDADHRREAVLTELRAYADLVTPGCYAVVADSAINNHPLPWLSGGGYEGPFEAIQDFLAERNDFEVDGSREYQVLTLFPSGFLRRKAARSSV